MLKTGDKAPDFNLPGIDANGVEKEFSLKDFAGKKVILYFYPKDNTPGCTTEACDFRDNLKVLSEKGYVVLGVSPNSIKSHLKFREKYELNFPLLSDSEKEVSALYGAYGEKKMYGKVRMGIIRSTFLIDETGKIINSYYNVRAKGHVERILKEL
jgi:peroxiredoxin Q/BCP